MNKTLLSSLITATLLLTTQVTASQKDETVISKIKTTKVTPQNYGLAETQVIFTGYVKKIAAATGTNGIGVWLHNKVGADPKGKEIMRINFDTIYSFAIVDLSKPATLEMPKTDGRYQTAWIITEEHYNPFAFDKAGTYKLTKENTGSNYVMIAIRTQANTADPKDLAIANALQERLILKQKVKGSYKASNAWNMDEILKMRAKYQKIQKDKDIKTEVMFGAKGLRTLENHNVGTAFGWGGFTPEQAVYPIYYPKDALPQTFTLKDVPVNAFYSITVYDKDGYPQTDTYNINSQFAKKNADGSVTIHFGGDKNQDNYMEIFEGWNFALRLYQPTKAYFDGSWKKPELKHTK